MSFRIRVYLQLPGGSKVRYIGERDLEERPVRGGHVIIEHEGKMETFRVDMIVPDHWEKIGGVPTITVVRGVTRESPASYSGAFSQDRKRTIELPRSSQSLVKNPPPSASAGRATGQGKARR